VKVSSKSTGRTTQKTPGYELTFEPLPGGAARTSADVVRVHRTDAVGAGGHPVYVDAGGTIRAEISDRGEVRMIATSARQVPRRPVCCRALLPLGWAGATRTRRDDLVRALD
jgi:Family of unknown function (DUF6296)